MHTTKIATCCYCGVRSALVLDAGRHELSCGSCGAPLHEMKSLPCHKQDAKPRPALASFPSARANEGGKERKKKVKKTKQRNDSKTYISSSKRPKRSRKLVSKKLVKKFWDIVEDVFD